MCEIDNLALSLTPKFTFYNLKGLCVSCLIFILHICVVIWLIHSFNQIVPFQSLSSASNSQSIQVRFLTSEVASKTTIPVNSTYQKEQSKQEKPIEKLLLTQSSSAREIQQKNHVGHAVQKEKSVQVVKNQPIQKKMIEKTSSTNATTSAVENESSNQKETSKNSTNTTNSNQQSNTSSQQKSASSSESAEKSKTVNTALKAINRRLNYPTRARSLGVEGRVRVQFDITSSGTLSNIRILSENPVGVFSDAVMKDMARWRYQTTGEVKNQVVNIVFKLDGRVVLDN